MYNECMRMEKVVGGWIEAFNSKICHFDECEDAVNEVAVRKRSVRFLSISCLVSVVSRRLSYEFVDRDLLRIIL